MPTSGDVVTVDLGLTVDSAAQCQHIRSVAVARIEETLGNVGTGVLAQIRGIVAVLLDL
jgi:mRNA interferase MazF